MVGEKVVVVADDDEDVLTLLSLQLRRLGFRVVTAADGEEALRRVEAERPTLVVLDAMMPGIDGLEAIRRLRADECTAKLPIVLISARARSADVDAGLGAGADAYLAKPFTARDLAAAIDGLV